jgi:hypothetical protein
MAIGVNWAEVWAPVWKAVWTDVPPVEVPDVAGDAQAAGTTELETALFVVAVVTAYSPSVAVGLIISQDPIGGTFASEGSTVTITVSLGPEPEPEAPTNLGGDDAWFYQGKAPKQKDYRPEIDEKRLAERQELRQMLERAAGLLEEAEETAAEQVVELKQELKTLATQLQAPRDDEPAKPIFDAVAAQARVDALIAKSVDDIVDRVLALLAELIQEINDDR